jgi:hypothetical protein
MLSSAAINFFNNSRKIITADGTHLKGFLEGVLCTINSLDANNQNVSLCSAVVGNENKNNWELIMDVVFVMFQMINMIICDRDKGLHAIRNLCNSVVEGWVGFKTIFAMCAKHFYENVVGKARIEGGLAIATNLCKASTLSKFDYWYKKLKEIIGEDKAEKFLKIDMN